jgi:hypothetical protein
MPEAQASRKRSVLIAGLGAACVASVLTVAMLTGTPPPATTTATDPPAKACKSMPPLMLAVSSEKGGTVRFREGDWLSPPITLTKEPQPVVFPRPRSQTEEIKEVITIEGQATDIVTVFPLTGTRDVYPAVNGVLSTTLTWLPFDPCK